MQYQFYISVITRFEIEIGLKSEQHQREYQQLLTRIVTLPVDTVCIAQAVEVHKYLIANNEAIGPADLLIGVTALQYDLPLATLNKKHFKRISQLSLVAVDS